MERVFSFDFNLEAWINGVEIEAESYKEALNKLNNMTVADLIDEGYVKEFNLSEIDVSVTDVEDDDDDSFYDDYEE